ncbi:MAG TPA: DNA recombination protein RmuC [Kiritimatiellia bacterium]|nr:DNA recombination protein RmuC [Kiritimatiellia bacterium]
MELAPLFTSFLIGGGLAAIIAIALSRNAAKTQSVTYEQRVADRDREIARLHAALEKLEPERTRLLAELESVKIARELEQAAATDKLKLLDEARENLRREFENLANRIFEEKGAKFTGQNAEKMESILTPLREQLGEFKKRVNEVYETDVRERTSLLQEIKQLKELNNRISKEATDLTLALKGESKTRGNWGELVLERVLELSGMTNGREYETQVFLREKHGGQQGRYPDVVVHLTDGRDVIIDSKVTLNAYERFVSAEDPATKASALKEHCQAVRQHINGLSAKNYQDLAGIKTLDLVMMCIPNEPAFIAAVAEDSSLHDDAMRRRVLLVGPTTLLLALRIIATMWRTENQNRNALEIADRGQKLYEKFVGFVEDLESVGASIDKAGQTYREAHGKLSSGSGNLIGQANKLVELGVKARKQLPESDV